MDIGVKTVTMYQLMLLFQGGYNMNCPYGHGPMFKNGTMEATRQTNNLAQIEWVCRTCKVKQQEYVEESTNSSKKKDE